MRPWSWKRMKASCTARPSIWSMVKRSRDQSTLAAILRSCVQMRLPFFSFQAQTRSRNFSRPRSCRVSFSCLRRSLSTTLWVAMPAWSVPGTQRVTSPHIRCQRESESSMAQVSVWPRCREPVTFGGGMTMMNLLDSFVCLDLAASGVKNPRFSHQRFQADSTAVGSYPSAISKLMSFFSPGGVSTTGLATLLSALALALASLLALPEPGSPARRPRPRPRRTTRSPGPWSRPRPARRRT
mmetsp:Transcript_49822/g.153863  ORF Transcript_49822/g.153863 Transcript_49822/m.153863 type:complete len:240 (-) Transcript_49822:2979-3698(-)